MALGGLMSLAQLMQVRHPLYPIKALALYPPLIWQGCFSNFMDRTTVKSTRICSFNDSSELILTGTSHFLDDSARSEMT